MHGDHDTGGQGAGTGGVDNLPGTAENQPLLNPAVLMQWDFVAHAELPAIPAATGVGEVEELAEVCVEVGLCFDTEVSVMEVGTRGGGR